MNQRRWRKSKDIKSSGAEIKTVSVHMHDYFVAIFVPSLAVENLSRNRSRMEYLSPTNTIIVHDVTLI